jgi:poly-beta-1,6-N-acetyl-D-glucosamine N-deacetylase
MTSFVTKSTQSSNEEPLPESPDGGSKSAAPWRRRATAASVTIACVLAVIIYITVPAMWQWRSAQALNVTYGPESIRPQAAAPDIGPSDPALLAQLNNAGTGNQNAPVVLTYHDIGYSDSEYTITPEAFAVQMQLLHDAHWQTLGAAQLSDWLRGSPMPPHSVLITFDDGASGVWRYADPVLARYNQRAMAFVITGFVGTHLPYYVTWPEVQSLGANGRWDIEAHTNLGHGKITIDAAGNQDTFLNNYMYLPDKKRAELPAEFQKRVTDDLVECKRQIIEHGLPEPKFFAFPFSNHGGEAEVGNLLHAILASLFSASMLDDASKIAVTTTDDLAEGNIERSDITTNATLEGWIERVVGSSAIAPAGSQPFAHPNEWTDSNDDQTTLNIDPASQGLTLDPGPKSYTARRYAAPQTSFWRNYTVSADLGGFRARDDGTTAGLVALSGDAQQLELNVSFGSYEVYSGKTNRVVASGRLKDATTYRASIDIHSGLATIAVNGKTLQTVHLQTLGPNQPAGGIAVSGNRSDVSSPVPVISNLTVS